MMKNTVSTEKFTVKEVKYDPSLDAYTNVSLFPKKMELALATIKKHGLPDHVRQTHRLKKPARSVLQNELLTVFALDPTAQQMQELTTFLYQLFGEQLKAAKTEEEEEEEEEAVPA